MVDLKFERDAKRGDWRRSPGALAARAGGELGRGPRVAADRGGSRRRALLALTLSALALLSHGRTRAAEPPLSLATVAKKLAQIEALSARFREQKRMALLADPLISEGMLYYERPRSLVRQTERPRKSTLLLSDAILTFGDAQRSERIELSSQPALRVLVDTFVSVLAGDLAALERVAELGFEARPERGFHIRVTPKDPQVKRLVRAMSFDGALAAGGARLSRMELFDASGDTTETTFSELTFRKRFSEAERARLFRLARAGG